MTQPNTTGVESSALTQDRLDIPFHTFVLDNGLTVNVYENHSTPLVSFNIWYRVGAKDETPGKTGFAHLFEHLMFAGSKHFPGSFMNNLLEVGATELNGTTSHDRTNYYETVPVGALDYLLFAESDRMGHFLETISQEALDLQRGVVLNEKSETEGAPYGGMFERQTRACYPLGHPYAHTVLGDADDLRQASLEDVQDWFRTYYTPNNAVITLAGAIDVSTARAKIETYFGDIPPGPPLARPPVWAPAITPGKREIYEDRVPQGCVQFIWNLPAIGDVQTDELMLVADLLAGDLSARLVRRAVYQDQLATAVYASVQRGQIASQFNITAVGRPGQSLDVLEQNITDELYKLIEQGPEEDELQRIKTSWFSAFINQHETNGAIAELLSSSHVQLGAPDGFQRTLDNLDRSSVDSLRDAMQRWLNEDRYTLTVQPFTAKKTNAQGVERLRLPDIGAPRQSSLPPLQRASLTNGLQVVLVERRSHPLVSLGLLFQAGTALDIPQTFGLTQLTRQMLNEAGAGERDKFAFSEAIQSLGASIGVGGGQDNSVISLRTLTSRLTPALDLFADLVLRPCLTEQGFEHARSQQTEYIDAECASGESIIARVLPGLLYPRNHPYASPSEGGGTRRSLAQLTFEQAIAWQRQWLRPDLATLLIVGDVSLDEILPLLEQRFRGWEPGEGNVSVIDNIPSVGQHRFFVIDMPGAEQSHITAASLVPGPGWANEAAFNLLNEIVSHGFGSRINMNLREEKHWTYGVRGILSNTHGPRLHGVSVAVQADCTANAIEQIRQELREVLSDRPVTDEELTRAKSRHLLRMAGMTESLNQLGSRVGQLLRHGWSDDHWDRYAERIENLSRGDLAEIAAKVIHPERMTWVVAGNLSVIREQLEGLGEYTQIVDAGDDLFDPLDQ
ncbi:peptidase M16 [Pectobacterium araliae]|uniref:Pitrilysin family protein n=1 Tax=Pectobacterium araliae TaxID=3073862 RepID=A0AAN0KG64_9GAMM|nr:pitrilysin family protein [Pectobacterium sp. MAFF 302110]GKW18337.1 peptidase M16 [Pectobacterium carotovorum subsp. carotovorum]